MLKPATEQSALTRHFLEFDIDRYLNPICPRQRFDLLPNFVSFWFGYRGPASKPQHRLNNILVCVSAAVGGFAGIAIITNVFQHLPVLGGHQAPLVIASFGAAAILEYNVIESPLSQPRNLIVGHFLAALVGVAVTKGFERLPAERFEELRWLSGSLAVGLASFVMGMTKTVHPPAGATALLASTNAEITMLGWWLLPLVLLAAVLMCASAQVINNLTRRWPLYWWTPADLTRQENDVVHPQDLEKQQSHSSSSSSSESGVDRTTVSGKENTTTKWHHNHDHNHNHNRARGSEVGSELTTVASHERDRDRDRYKIKQQDSTIMITADQISMPNGWDLNDWEKEILEIFKSKLQTTRNSVH